MQTAMIACALTDLDLDHVSGGGPDGGASPDAAPAKKPETKPAPTKTGGKDTSLIINVKGTGGAGKKPGVEGTVDLKISW
jgi:hypothetical protein